MKRIMRKCLAVCLATICCAVSLSEGADGGRILRSSVFPGMGQLGDGQTVKGLSFMAAEVMLITLTVGQFSRAHSLARETEYRQIEFDTAGTYEERSRRYQYWSDAYDDADKAQKMGFVFGGLAVVCWGLNVVDAALFAPRDEEDASSPLKKLLRGTTVAVVPNGGRLTCTVEF